MILRHPVVALAATAGWLVLTSGYGAAAAEPTVDLGGAPLPGGTGSTDSGNPTSIEAGLWADRLADAQSGSAAHYFTYERQMRFSTVHVGVIGSPTDADGDGFEVEILGPERIQCASSSAPYSYAVPHEAMGARVWAGPDQLGDLQAECLLATSLDIVVARTNTGSGELPVAIKVVEEAPTTGAGSLPEPEESPTFQPGADPAGGAELKGATDFDSAPQVAVSGGTAAFTTTVTEGEQRLYRLPLTWGQELSVDAIVPKVDVSEDDYDHPDVEISLVDPLRDVVDDAVAGTTASATTSADETTRLSTALPAISYLNRYTDGPATVPGDYWLSIAVSPAEEFEPIEVPVDVEVSVADVTEGEPTYEGDVQAADTGAGPSAYSPETPFLIGPDEFSAVASGTPVLPDAEDDGWWGARRYAGIGLAVASLLCCGLGIRRLL